MTLSESAADSDGAYPRPAACFEVAGGWVTGADHLRTGRPGQDALAWLCSDDMVVATVCDGCGSAALSQVGAALGARLWTQALARRLASAEALDRPESWPAVWRDAAADVCAVLADLASRMGGAIEQVIAEYFLFTIVGAAITPRLSAVFAIGDGVVAVDGRTEVIGPFPDNQPPYLAYRAMPGAIAASDPLNYCIFEETERVNSLVIATDGAADLSDGLGQFTGDRCFRNRDAIRRQLALLSRSRAAIDWDAGCVARTSAPLRDDTAVVAIRRVPGGAA
ncbi:MAG: protein phosphatase 2C domain-containing protein [Myxococcota bacterium]